MTKLSILLASTLIASAAQAVTTIDFTTLDKGPITSASGVTFSLGGGGDGSQTVANIGNVFGDAIQSLNNGTYYDETFADYPTRRQLTFTFDKLVTDVSFTFNNYGNGNGTSYTIFDGDGDAINTVLIDQVNSFDLVTVSGSGIKSLVIDNNDEFSWQFGVGQLNFSAVPEPATWAMMIVGFGLVGGLARRRAGAATIAA